MAKEREGVAFCMMRLYFYIMENQNAALPQNFSLQETLFRIEKFDLNRFDFIE
jgi:hypothetical protein